MNIYKYITTISLFAAFNYSAFATTLEPLTDPERVELADIAFVGRVEWTATTTDPTDNTVRETIAFVVLDPIKFLNGEKWPNKGDIVQITKRGGKYGNRVTIVSGMPQFKKGDIGVAMLDYTLDGTFPFTLMERGWTTIRNNMTFPSGHDISKPQPAVRFINNLRRYVSNQQNAEIGMESFLEGEDIPKNRIAIAGARRAANDYLKELGSEGVQLTKAARMLKARKVSRNEVSDILTSPTDFLDEYSFLSALPDFPDELGIKAAIWKIYGIATR